jgi:chromosomal replication initiator protein
MSDGFPFHQFLRIDENDKKVEALTESPIKYISNIEDLQVSENPSLEETQQKILFFLSNNIEKPEFDQYIKNSLVLVNIHNKTIELRAASKQVLEIIENKYWNLLSEAIFKSTGTFYNIQLSAASESQKDTQVPEIKEDMLSALENQNPGSTPQKTEKKPSAKDHYFTLDLTPSNEDLKNKVETRYIETVSEPSLTNIDSRKTFQNFVVGPSNNMAFASCIAAAKNPGKNYPTVYIHSKSGLGKTHLLHAVGNLIHKNYPKLKVLFTTAQNFLQEMVDSIREQKIEAFRKKYTEQIDVLMIDDIHELKNKQGTQNAFFHIFNDLYSKGKQLFFTSDKTPKEIDGIEERIKTRLSWGLVLDIQQPDLETRIAILKKKAQEEDIYLPDDVITLIASSIKDNIRELEGSLIKLAAYSSIFKQDIDTEIAKRELKLDEIKDTSELTLEKIAKSVSLYFKIPVADLKSKSRIKEVANARHIAMYLSYKLLKTNYTEIGKFYGNRDHSTVLIGVRKITESIKENMSLSHNILEIENNL